MVYGLLSYLHVLCIVALLTFWSVSDECVFPYLVSRIFYFVHVVYMTLQFHKVVIHVCFYTIHLFIRHLNFIVTWICMLTFVMHLIHVLNLYSFL